MKAIDTITVNPTIDVAYELDRLVPVRKLRASAARHDPGGGGLNVARVFVRLGGNARCHYMAGGASGEALDALLDLHQLVVAKTAIAAETRLSTTVFERATGQEYRIVAPGPDIADTEWRAFLDRLEQTESAYIVASGSLARGLPDDFYARIARIAHKKGARFVLDSSGRGLLGGLSEGGVYLVKPNLEELRDLAGSPLHAEEDIAQAAREIVARGDAHHLAVTMGEQGAMLVNGHGVYRMLALPVETVSTVGAGDSFVAAMVHALADGRDLREAFRFGAAAGAAAVSTPGTDLARAEDIARIFRAIPASA